jgi:hypothetical protein
MSHLGLSLHRLLNMRPLTLIIYPLLQLNCIIHVSSRFKVPKCMVHFELMSQGILHCLLNISLSTTSRFGNFGLAITSPSHAPLLFTLFQRSMLTGLGMCHPRLLYLCIWFNVTGHPSYCMSMAGCFGTFKWRLHQLIWALTVPKFQNV